MLLRPLLDAPAAFARRVTTAFRAAALRFRAEAAFTPASFIRGL